MRAILLLLTLAASCGDNELDVETAKAVVLDACGNPPQAPSLEFVFPGNDTAVTSRERYIALHDWYDAVATWENCLSPRAD